MSKITDAMIVKVRNEDGELVPLEAGEPQPFIIPKSNDQLEREIETLKQRIEALEKAVQKVPYAEFEKEPFGYIQISNIEWVNISESKITIGFNSDLSLHIGERIMFMGYLFNVQSSPLYSAVSTFTVTDHIKELFKNVVIKTN